MIEKFQQSENKKCSSCHMTHIREVCENPLCELFMAEEGKTEEEKIEASKLKEEKPFNEEEWLDKIRKRGEEFEEWLESEGRKEAEEAKEKREGVSGKEQRVKEERAINKLPEEFQKRINVHVFRCNKSFARGIENFSEFISASKIKDYLKKQVLSKLVDEIDKNFPPNLKSLARDAFLEEIGFDQNLSSGITSEKFQEVNEEYKKAVLGYLKESYPWIFWL